MKKKTMKNEGIKVGGRIGTWYVIDKGVHNGEWVYLLESEIYGNDAEWLITDGEANEIMETGEGFADLDYL